METTAGLSAAVHAVLDKHNYEDWSVRVQTYLMAHDLWVIVNATTEHPNLLEDDEATIMVWRKKNSMALHVIQISCGSDAFSKIRKITSARDAWDTLEGMYVPKNTGMDNNESNFYDEYVALSDALRSGNLYDARELIELQPNAVNMAKRMLSGNKKLVSIGNATNILPVVMAIQFRHTALAGQLYSLTPPEDLMPENGVNGATLCTQAIYTRNLDFAWSLIKSCPRLTLALDRDNCSPLYALSAMAYAIFQSGDQLACWNDGSTPLGTCIQSAGATNEIRLDVGKVEKRQSDQAKTIGSVLARLRQLVSNLRNFSGIEHLHEMEGIHAHCQKLLDLMSKEISMSNMQQRQKGCVDGAIFCAIKNGNFEFLFRIVKENPDLLRTVDRDSRNIFLLAVLHRQAKIFSLIYGLEEKKVMIYDSDAQGNFILHMAGMSAPSTLLNHISGPALEVQRELQWFKEVESIVHP
ncbi:uncharacterized protein LOC133879086 [Alnus glutinosa]|uniref:uncharacterized protein LOC133879086 n=1 Tax=Alnus glutinosa TaxID=3517 RepID=UPI002D765143|nr:uncharacterized protein LOC133879086 [Alnus glutinosa]